MCNEKTCPIKNNACIKDKCMWWCNFANDCSIPLLAGMFADSSVCNNVFETIEELKENN